MKNVGMMGELGLQVGDTFRSNSDSMGPTYTVTGIIEGGVIIDWDGLNPKRNYKELYKNSTHIFRIISRATPQPKLWRDMTAEEKGALLLAAHEGKVIQYTRIDIPDDWRETKTFMDFYAYRVKPKPKVETLTLTIGNSDCCGGGEKTDNLVSKTHRITFKTIDGKPDCASVRMEAI